MAKLVPIFSVVGPNSFPFQPVLPFAFEVLRLYLNVGYYLGLIPYRLTWVEQKGYILHKNALQKVLCILVSGGVSFCMISSWTREPKKDAEEPAIFSTFLATVGNFTVACFLYTFWTHHYAFEWIFETECNLVFKSWNSKREIKYVALNQKQSGQFWNYFTRKQLINVLLAVTVYILTSGWTLYTYLKTVLEADISTNLILVVLVILASYLFLVVHFFDLFIVILALLLKGKVDTFVEALVQNRITGNEVIKLYRRLKAYVGKINEFFGPWTFVAILGALPFYCLEVTKAIRQGIFTLQSLSIITYVLFFISSLIAASDSNSKMEKVVDWLGMDDNVSKIPQPQLTLLLHELGKGSIGLKGGKYFIVSYRFIGSIFSILLTYIIVVLQWKWNSQDKAE